MVAKAVSKVVAKVARKVAGGAALAAPAGRAEAARGAVVTPAQESHKRNRRNRSRTCLEEPSTSHHVVASDCNHVSNIRRSGTGELATRVVAKAVSKVVAKVVAKEAWLAARAVTLVEQEAVAVPVVVVAMLVERVD